MCLQSLPDVISCNGGARIAHSIRTSDEGMHMETRDELVELEHRFWQALLDGDTDTALSLMNEPMLRVTALGVTKVGRTEYRDLAESGQMVLKEYHLSDVDVVFPADDVAVLAYAVRQTIAPRGRLTLLTQNMADTSMWVRKNGRWRCAMHTETEVP
jgi:hypothetical protein